MSYILDALRKAERERGIRQVPTLMTDHAPRNANRKRLWIGLGIVGVILAAVLGGYFVHERETPVAELKPGAGYNRDVTGSDADQNRATALDAGASTTASSLRVPAANRPDASTERTTIATAIPRAPSAIVPRNESREQTRQNIRPAIPEEDEVILDEIDEEDLPPHELMRNATRPVRASATPEPPKTQSASLKEVAGKMILSLLVFADSREERMVYINGRKYEEGEYVEGLYLLESITEDGAMLSYQGERVLLQPKSK